MEPQIITAFHPGLKLMIPIKEAANGLACGCHCTLCGKPLIAVQGNPTWHYRHYEVSACPGGPMTELHSRAISMLLSHNTLKVGGEKIVYGQAAVQQKSGRFMPDITAAATGEQLLLEVRVTHACEASKIAYYRENRHASIEINLSDLAYDADDTTLYRELFINGENKTWIYCPQYVSTPAPPSYWFSFRQAILALLGLIIFCGIARYSYLRGRQKKRYYSLFAQPKKSYWR